MKFIIQRILKFIAKAILKKYRPQVIGVTGSVGKTSTKEAINLVLGNFKRVRGTYRNYNNEFGVPLTIIGAESAGKSIIGWLKIIFQGIGLVVTKNVKYPEVLVLEMGVRTPGDMSYLMSFVKPDIYLVTSISEMPSLLEFFNSVGELVKEEFHGVESLRDNGIFIYNIDSPLAKDHAKKYQGKVKVLNIGFNNDAVVKAENIILTRNPQTHQIGLNFKLEYKGVMTPVFIPNLIASYQLYPILSAIAVAIHYGKNLVEISQYLKDYKVTKGRMHIIEGIKDSIIIDDTYNSSPDAVSSAIKAVDNLYKYMQGEKRRKIFIMGDMLELGVNEERAHMEMGEELAQIADKVFLVGDRVVKTKDELLKKKFKKDNIQLFNNSEECANVIADQIDEKDLVLVKGSQGIRMEKVVLSLLRHPSKAGDLLVRQDSQWIS